MKPFTTLIRLAKAEVEEKQKSLAETITRQDKIISQKIDLENLLAAESKAATKFPEMAANFGKFSRATLDKIKVLEKEIARLEKIIEEKQDELREAFAGLKRYEIALEIKLREQKQKQDRLEQIKMDEIGAAKRHLEHAGSEA